MADRRVRAVDTCTDEANEWRRRILQVSADGGSDPLWRGDGRELFYRKGDQVLAVSVKSQPGFQAGPPQRLFEGEFSSNPHEPVYGVTPDGERFVMMQPVQGDEPERALRVVLGFDAELSAAAGER